MYGLTYEQRKRAVFEFLYCKDGGLLRRYRAPEHLSDDAMRDEVNLLVEDINQLIPNEQTESNLRLLFAEINGAIRRRHGAQGWPPAKIFIAATEDAVAEAAKKKAASAPAGASSFDPYEITSAKMRAGEPVSEGYLWGREAVQLIARGLIDQTTMRGTGPWPSPRSRSNTARTMPFAGRPRRRPGINLRERLTTPARTTVAQSTLKSCAGCKRTSTQSPGQWIAVLTRCVGRLKQEGRHDKTGLKHLPQRPQRV